MIVVVNGATNIVLVYSVPIFLANVRTTQDFVLNSFVIAFLIDLDDSDDPN